MSVRPVGSSSAGIRCRHCSRPQPRRPGCDPSVTPLRCARPLPVGAALEVDRRYVAGRAIDPARMEARRRCKCRLAATCAVPRRGDPGHGCGPGLLLGPGVAGTRLFADREGIDRSPRPLLRRESSLAGRVGGDLPALGRLRLGHALVGRSGRRGGGSGSAMGTEAPDRHGLARRCRVLVGSNEISERPDNRHRSKRRAGILKRGWARRLSIKGEPLAIDQGRRSERPRSRAATGGSMPPAP